MPAQRNSKGAGKSPAPKRRARKPATPPPAADEQSAATPTATVTVRMLYGERAGQIVQVTREKAAELIGGWTPRAEPVAVRPVDQRETR